MSTRQVGDETVLAPARGDIGERENFENPEFYAVFPYRRYGIGRSDLGTARETFARREIETNSGWAQDPVQVALLGLTDVAREQVAERFADSYEDARFPAF